MDICVLGAQAPFVRGGAEQHMENLVAALQAEGHRADLVRLPVAWDRQVVLEAALAWRLVTVRSDLVIATNFPSYFIRHERKVVWLFHQHRPAYDAVDAPWSDFDLTDDALEIQRQLSDWDARVLEEAERLYTTSNLVAERLRQFNGLEATPLYHPPPLHDRLRPGPFGRYVFCATRLEQNKRPDRLVDGLGASRSGASMIIAGTGWMRTELEQRAEKLGVAKRLQLPGFVDAEELVDLYAGALAVVYAPHEEDYGYVTLQAFYAHKPVITTVDAGGVLEWVEDGVTGLVTDGSAEGIGEAIDRLAADPGLARRMGDAGYELVRDLDWKPVVETLVGE